MPGVEAGVVVVGPALGGDRVGVEQEPGVLGDQADRGGAASAGAQPVRLATAEVDLRPTAGARSPTRCASSVDLPAPLRPISASTSPARTCTSTPRSATTGP